MDVNGRLDLFVQSVFADIADDADDAQRVVVAVHIAVLNRVAERVFIRKMAARQRFADQRDLLRVGAVDLIEEPPAQEPDAHRVEITRTGDAEFSVAFQGLIIVNQKPAVRSRASHWQTVHAADSRDAGQRAGALDQLLIKTRPAPGRVFSSKFGRRHLYRHGALGSEAGIDLQELKKAPDQQPRADQQHQRQGHLRRYQQAAQSLARGARRLGATALFQALAQIAPAEAKERQQAERDSDQRRKAKCEDQGAGIDADLIGAW